MKIKNNMDRAKRIKIDNSTAFVINKNENTYLLKEH